MKASRREVLGAGAAMPIVGAAEARASGTGDGYPEPALSFAFQADVELGPVQELGMIDGMRRRIIPIVGGSVIGPRFRGEILPGGADWQGVRPGDFLTRVYARYWMRAEDGTVVGIENSGVRRAPLAVMERLMAGTPVSPGDYYFRTVPFFEVGEGPHRWLNETMFVCVGARSADKAVIRFYAVA